MIGYWNIDQLTILSLGTFVFLIFYRQALSVGQVKDFFFI